MQYMNTMTLDNDIVPLVSGGVKCPNVFEMLTSMPPPPYTTPATETSTFRNGCAWVSSSLSHFLKQNLGGYVLRSDSMLVAADTAIV